MAAARHQARFLRFRGHSHHLCVSPRIGFAASVWVAASAKAPAYFMAGYAASKAALHSFFDAMRAELGVTGRGNVSVTLQVLGMIGTEQVMEEQSLHGIAMPVQECAAAMVCAERSRTHESYIPGYIWGLVRLNVFLPGVTDWAMRTMFVMRVPEYVERIAAAASGIAAA